MNTGQYAVLVIVAAITGLISGTIGGRFPAGDPVIAQQTPQQWMSLVS